jgi:hypothetical protein
MKIRRIVTIVGVVLCAAASHAAAQTPTTCGGEWSRSTSDSSIVGRTTFLGGPVTLRCPSRGITMHGDSAEQYPDRYIMIGHAVFDDPRLHATSQFMTYYPADEKIIAVGDVHARLPSGSTLVGPIATWLRATPKRPRQDLTAVSRPTITIVQNDSAGKPQPPTVVVAQYVHMDGDSLIYGSGDVVITQPDISATADSVAIDETKETMRLMRSPKLVGKKEKAYTLKGDLIDAYSVNKKLNRVISRGNAIAISDSMTLSSDTIDLRVRDDLLDHANAWGKNRAHVVSTSQDILSDSLDVFMPKSKLQLVRAIRKAFAQGKVDTTKYRLADKSDTTVWLRGDTIVAHFDTIPQTDTSKTPPIKLLVADGHASSVYHMPPSDTGAHSPAIGYMSARTINVNFNLQKVATVTGVDSVTGVYIEPKPDTTGKKKPAAKTPAGKTPAKPPVKPPLPSVDPLLPNRQ